MVAQKKGWYGQSGFHALVHDSESFHITTASSEGITAMRFLSAKADGAIL